MRGMSMDQRSIDSKYMGLKAMDCRSIDWAYRLEQREDNFFDKLLLNIVLSISSREKILP